MLLFSGAVATKSISISPQGFLAFLLNVVSDQPEEVTAPYTNSDLAIFRRYGATRTLLSFGANSSVLDLLSANLYP